MSRQAVRQLKRAVADGKDTDAMQALLQRSVRFGHKRLALMRCIQAEQLGIAVLPETLHYCQRVADAMRPDELARLIRQVTAAH
ncbi:hypothetical protein [Noviherbaspirillum saxi]|uniref:Uncharacterized protein n=1 Tax=Noviherbaspirillum saxi TaxID=2320863 RepID=A0A3A3FIZ9_9BURK|nr:hypothetical protein [Noviherbaspirillum saxi]RJF95257.1 hypothetical protein D3871_17610 [Noviherbaspirillum saxi]